MANLSLLPAHHRRAFLRHAGFWAVGTALSPTAWPAAPLWPVTVAVAQPHAMAHMPLVLAHALGYFQGEGLQVTLISHSTEDSAVQSVLQGRAAVVACTYAHTLSQHALGGDMQAFLLQLRAPQVVLGASLKTLGHYRSPADLRGKRVGVLASAAPGHLVLGGLLHSAGLKPADTSLVVFNSSADLLARYRAGELDVLSANDPLVTLLEQRGEIRVLADTRSVHGTQALLGGPVPGGALCAPAAWLSQQPDTAQALTHGAVRALKWLQTAGPADLIKALPEPVMGADRALYLAAFDKARGAFSPDGVLHPEAARAALTVHARLDPALQVADIALAATYTNQFSLKAKTRFRA